MVKLSLRPFAHSPWTVGLSAHLTVASPSVRVHYAALSGQHSSVFVTAKIHLFGPQVLVGIYVRCADGPAAIRICVGSVLPLT